MGVLRWKFLQKLEHGLRCLFLSHIMSVIVSGQLYSHYTKSNFDQQKKNHLPIWVNFMSQWNIVILCPWKPLTNEISAPGNRRRIFCFVGTCLWECQDGLVWFVCGFKGVIRSRVLFSFGVFVQKYFYLEFAFFSVLKFVFLRRCETIMFCCSRCIFLLLWFWG